MNMNFNRLGTAIVFAAAMSAMLPASSRADVIYTYTGKPFTQISGPYTTSDFVSGSIDVATALGANYTYNGSLSYTYSFTDGVQTLTGTVATSHITALGTDATGAINIWEMAFGGGPTLLDIIEVCNGTSDCNGPPLTNDNVMEFHSRASSPVPGSWAGPVVTAVPEPATWAMLLLGFGIAGRLIPDQHD
jgi:hypothetical protein